MSAKPPSLRAAAEARLVDAPPPAPPRSAEGVETEAQLARLDQYGCAAYQGFLFSRPLPVEEFEAWLGNPPFFQRGAGGI